MSRKIISAEPALQMCAEQRIIDARAGDTSVVQSLPLAFVDILFGDNKILHKSCVQFLVQIKKQAFEFVYSRRLGECER
jgi:hypothetical protein